MSDAGGSDALPKAPTDTSEPETPSPFDDQIVRRAFVRKVFGIQILTLLVTFGMVCLFTFSDVVKKGVQDDFWVFWCSFLVFPFSIIIVSILLCIKRHRPWNLMGLVLVTLSFSYMLGAIAALFNTYAVLFGLADTILIFLAIIVFNAQSCVVFNMCYGLILIVALPLLMLGIMYGIFSSNPTIIGDVALGGTGALCLSLLFMVDVQLMTWRKKDRVGPQEYTVGALFLYLDILLFLGQYGDLLCCITCAAFNQ